MLVSLVAAVASNRVIGKDGALPWRLPADMAHFKRLTMGHPVIMGRRTFLTLKKPLAGRLNIVLSRDPGFQAAGALVVHSPEEALNAAGGAGEVFVAGGAEVYALFLPRADRLYITHVEAAVEGSELFPVIDPALWNVVESAAGAVDEKNPLPHRFTMYERK